MDVKPRDVRRRITVTGRGNISRTHTSDLWPWTGKDGRDYCLVGTWGADGYAIVFDITDMNNIVKPIPSDRCRKSRRNGVARWTYGVLTREERRSGKGVGGSSTCNPRSKVASTFDQPTGGVHNAFATTRYFPISGVRTSHRRKGSTTTL